jgi:hypothetical protein
VKEVWICASCNEFGSVYYVKYILMLHQVQEIGYTYIKNILKIVPCNCFHGTQINVAMDQVKYISTVKL